MPTQPLSPEANLTKLMVRTLKQQRKRAEQLTAERSVVKSHIGSTALVAQDRPHTGLFVTAAYAEQAHEAGGRHAKQDRAYKTPEHLPTVMSTPSGFPYKPYAPLAEYKPLKRVQPGTKSASWRWPRAVWNMADQHYEAGYREGRTPAKPTKPEASQPSNETDGRSEQRSQREIAKALRSVSRTDHHGLRPTTKVVAREFTIDPHILADICGALDEALEAVGC